MKEDNSINFKPLIIFLLCLSMGAVNSMGQENVPKKARVLFQKAYTQYEYGEYAIAEDLFLQAIKKHPTYINAYDALAKVYQVQKKKDQAIASYRKVLQLQPGHRFAQYELGVLYFEDQDLDSSAYFYKSFLAANNSVDKYAQNARGRLENIAFATEAMKHPVAITPINLGPAINSDLEEYSPAFTIDESVMFITQRNGKLDYHRQNEDIFYAVKTADIWERIKDIGAPINTIENEGAFSVSSDGNYIFYTACSKSGGLGQCDIWLTVNKGETWSDPMNLRKPVNSKHWESQPCIASNGKHLYFTSDRPGGFGGTDLYMSTFGDDGWGNPVNLGPEINTSRDEQFPFIHSDNVTLYFSSEGHLGMGQSDLFKSNKKPDGTWEKPVNLGYPINTTGNDWNLVVTRDAKTAYYSSDKIKEGYGGMDIYSFELPDHLRAKKVSYIRGHVKEAKSNKPLGSAVILTPLDNSSITNARSDNVQGQFTVALTADKRYSLSIDKPGYLFHSEYFDMPNVDSDKPFDIHIYLKKIEVGNKVVLNNIFFDTDKYELKSESTYELAKLVDFLTHNQSIRIEIGGHTDNVGNADDNQVLSMNRAKAVYDFLIKQGVASERLGYQGYGDTEAIASNENPSGRAKNRRTEFKIINCKAHINAE